MVMNCALSKLSQNLKMYQKQQQTNTTWKQRKNWQQDVFVIVDGNIYEPCQAPLQEHISRAFYVQFLIGKCVEIFNTKNNSVLQFWIYIIIMS